MNTKAAATTIKVGLGSCGVAAGARKVLEALEQEIKGNGADVDLKVTGCIGMCFREPLIEVSNTNGSVIYGDVTPDRVPVILEEHVKQGKPVAKWIVHGEGYPRPDDSFLAKQYRIVLRNCGIIDPENIDEYIQRNGYSALPTVLRDWSPERVIDTITRSGLRGRGGAGFPTGQKWSFTRRAVGTPKYVVCNGDEGDPGAFMDRSVLESDPHAVIEGMLIAGYAIGASEGFMYVRAEYPLAIHRLNIALDQSRKRGYIGKNILGSGYSFDIKLKQGAGAFVCGEETALIASVEGRRGMPRLRPPFPAVSGLWGKPTNINNVETFANVPWIILNGAEAFAALGTEKSKGTKVFALAGKTARGGLVEVPMGITLREIVNDIGGGTITGRPVKAVQMGGPSGGCIPTSLMDTKVDYEEVTRTGAIMGSGGMIVLDESTCMVDVAKFFLNFTQRESCGKCTFCRIGTRRMLEILTRISEGKSRPGDVDLLGDLAQKVKLASLCGLGQTAPNPVLTTLRYFRDEYDAHVNEKRCPAVVCRALLTVEIDPEKCTGCGACKRACPVSAIMGEKKKPHTIDPAVCTRCKICYETCKFDAISAR